MKKALLLLAALVLTGSLFARGSQEQGGVSKIVVASDVAYPPMEFIDENGNMVGFDIDMINAMAEVDGFEVEIRDTAWEGIFAGLLNGAYDAVCSAVSITEERKQTMDFTDVYFNTAQVLILKADAEGIGSLQDMLDQDLAVGVQIGTTGALALDEYEGIKSREYNTTPLAIEDLLNGNVDGVVCDAIVANDFVLSNEAFAGRLKLAGEPFNDDPYGVAVLKGNTEVLGLLNKALDILQENGTMDELYAKWMQ